MTRAQLVARRTRVRAREERYYRLWRLHSRRGKKLKKGSDAQLKNAKSRKWYSDHYRKSRAARRALDRRIAKLPITQVDEAGEKFIIQNEGVVLHPYNDSRGLATIGVGHLIGMRPVTAADRAKYRNFDLHDAMALLARDLDSYEAAVAKSFKPKGALKATHNRFNALTSFCFNIGTGGYTNSTAADGVRRGKTQVVVDGMRLWKKPPEIGARREREISLFKR